MSSSFNILLVLSLVNILGTGARVGIPARSVGRSTTDTCPQTATARNELQQQISAILTDITTVNFTCGGTQGWRRVVNLDMTDSSQSCPDGFILKLYSPEVRSCGRANQLPGCSSTFFNISGPYSRVCGRVRGYQFGSSSAFLADGLPSPEHFEGISLSHGSARTHIWTFAAGLAEVYGGQFSEQFCPCVTNQAPSPPVIVGNDYFCESGIKGTWMGTVSFRFYSDPLWDGQNCVNNACCQVNAPPYFTKVLPTPTSDDIELQLCSEDAAHLADIPFDQVELYVQ